MTHSNSIVYGNGIKFGCKTAQFFYFSFYFLTNIVQMYMTRNKLSE